MKTDTLLKMLYENPEGRLSAEQCAELKIKLKNEREIKQPQTKKDGLRNFVKMIINDLEDGNNRRALLTARDLLDSLHGNIYQIKES